MREFELDEEIHLTSRAVSVVLSCDTFDQLAISICYADLAARRLPSWGIGWMSNSFNQMISSAICSCHGKIEERIRIVK